MTDLAKINATIGDDYAIERELGRGGMATVYLARDIKHDRDVALKILRPELAAALGTERFLAEIKLTAGLQHPNILPLFNSGAAGEVLYYVMPYVRGETLRARLEREKALPVDEAITIARGIASALDHAHRQGIVHRDVKPENVLFSDDVPIVADFGIARAITAAGATRVTAVGTSLGTPAYMSPEQAMGEEDVDRRADIYSLGCVLFEMLAGEPPFNGATAQAVIAQHLTAPAPSARDLRDTIPPTVDSAIMRALSKDRDERFDTASELSAALTVTPPVEPLPDYSKVTEPITRSTTPLAGRQKEFAELIAKLDAVAEGRGGMVLVGGEPGVGKTKLTEALLLEARARGYPCAVGHCYEMEGAPPYLPFVEQIDYATRTVPPGRLRAVLGSGAAEIARIMPRLRQLYPDIPEPLDLPPDQQRHYLLTQIVGYYERGTKHVPLVLLFDDLHWADDSTLLLLEHLATHLSRIRLLILGTYRDVDLEVARPFAKCLERLTRQRLADRIALRRMPDTEVADLLAQLGGPNPPASLVRAIFAETEGNPFFVEEVFRHLRDEGRLTDADGRWLPTLEIETLEVPEGVKLVIGRRLERVSEACRGMLTSAAVIGPRFELGLLEEVSDLSSDDLLDALEEAERAGLIIAQEVKRGAYYTFAHELTRQTLLGALSVPRRLRHHLKTAHALEAMHAGREAQHASELAYHYFQSGSGDEEKTTGYLLLAGQQALEAGAFDEALAQADRAFSVIEDSEPRRRADLLRLRASALRGLGEWKAAMVAYEETIELLSRLDAQTALLAVTCMLMDVMYYIATDYARGVEIVDRILRSTQDVPSLDRARLLAIGANMCELAGDHAAGESMSARAVDMSKNVGDPEALGMVLGERASLLVNAGYITDALKCARESVELLEHTAKRWALLRAKSRVVYAVRFACRPREVQALAKEAVPEAEAVGHVGAKLAMDSSLMTAGWNLDPHVDTFEEASDRFEQEYRDFGTWGEMGVLLRGWAAWERGHEDQAATLEGAAERFGFDAWRDLWWTCHFTLMACEDVAKARAILAANKHRVPVAGQHASIGARTSLGFLIEGLLVLGDKDAVAALYPVCEECLVMGLVGDIRLTNELAGIAATAAADFDSAEGHFAVALRIANEVGNVAAQAEVRLSHARMLLERKAAGDTERARTMLEEALPMFEKSGRTRWVRKSRELLGTANGDP
jgi:tetratricopeptide (TPR) repeat protein